MKKINLAVAGAWLVSALAVNATIVGNPLIPRQYATDQQPNVFVVDFGAGTGTLTSVLTYSQTTDGSGYASPGYSFDAYVLA